MQENHEVGSPWDAHRGSVESRPEEEFKRQQRTLQTVTAMPLSLITQGRFGVSSSDDEDTSVAVSRVPHH